MMRAVSLHDQTMTQAKKVYDIAPERDLSPKLQSIESTVAQE